jgi:hypothetical protein
MDSQAYSVWSRGRLVGHTSLDLMRVFPNHRTGWLAPAGDSDSLLERATETTPASFALGRLLRASRDGDHHVLSADEMRRTQEFADFIAATTHQEGLELELRRADGSIVPTEWVDIRDTDAIVAIGRQIEEDFRGTFPEFSSTGDEELDEEIREIEEELSSEEWKGVCDVGDADDLDGPPPPDRRYQVQVMLIDGADVP